MKSRNLCNLLGYRRFDSLEFRAYMNYWYGYNLKGLLSAFRSSEKEKGEIILATLLLIWTIKKEEISNGPGGLQDYIGP